MHNLTNDIYTCAWRNLKFQGLKVGSYLCSAVMNQDLNIIFVKASFSIEQMLGFYGILKVGMELSIKLANLKKMDYFKIQMF